MSVVEVCCHTNLLFCVSAFPQHVPAVGGPGRPECAWADGGQPAARQPPAGTQHPPPHPHRPSWAQPQHRPQECQLQPWVSVPFTVGLSLSCSLSLSFPFSFSNACLLLYIISKKHFYAHAYLTVPSASAAKLCSHLQHTLLVHGVEYPHMVILEECH